MKKRFIRSLALLLTMSMLAGLCCIGAAAYDYSKPNNYTNTGDYAKDLVGVAQTQVGYTDNNGDDRTKYNEWYFGEDTVKAWCAVFTSWCANQAAIPTTIIHKNDHVYTIPVSNAAAYNAVADSYFGGTAYDFGAKTPEPGDLFFSVTWKNTDYATHTGIVEKVDSNYIYTIEGNTHVGGVSYVYNRQYKRSTGYQYYSSSKTTSSYVHLLFFVHPNYESIHEHEYSVVVTPATCLTAGYTTHTCSICGESYQDAEVAALGHSYTDTVTASTCTEKGYTTHTCSRCGDSYIDTEVAALSHSFTTYTYNDDADICKDGTETAACDHGCGATKSRTSAGTALQDPNEKNPFIDVVPNEYYYDPVLWAVEQGITNGTTDTTFSPDVTCTRAQVVTFLWRAASCPEPKTTSCSFQDIKPGEYYYKAVLWAVEQGITNGTSDTTFSPDDTCKRAQVVTFLWRAASCPEPKTTSCSFQDIKLGEYYYEAVLWAVEQGITNGTSDTTFSPDATCKRAQIVTFLWRAASNS